MELPVIGPSFVIELREKIQDKKTAIIYATEDWPSI